MARHKSGADYLAHKLSEYTGSEFTVLPHQIDGRLLYGLRATRGQYSHQFQPHRLMEYRDLVRWLASICDMVNLGFIPVKLGERK